MKTIHHTYEVVVIGGGLAGLCAAVTSARQGIRTALVHDRPVLGGNASIEIRVPPVGATQCNFAYSRETGLIEELFLNNLHRNPTWCPEGWNLELENLVRNEPDLDLFLNNAVCDVAMHESNDRVASVKSYCSMEETWHVFEAGYFADCSGDGVVGSLSGASFRMRVEARAEFNEPMCPVEPTGDTMGMSLHLHARDAGRPMPFTRPKWVDLELSLDDFGPYRPVCEHLFPDTGGFWWLEWGGALDTVHDTTRIKEEVQRITLAVWDFLKNRSSLAEKLETFELDWMGAVPGKRESQLHYRFHQGPANKSTFPEELLAENSLEIPAGQSQWIDLPIDCVIQRPGWHFLILEKNPDLAVHMTETPPGKRWNYPRPEDPIRPNHFTKWTSRSLMIGMTRAVDADGAGVVAPDWNDHARNFRPESLFLNFAHCCRTLPAQELYNPELAVNGESRPTHVPNLWVSAPSSFAEPEWISLSWESPKCFAEVQLLFDSSLHFHFWQSWQGYQLRSIPSIIRDYRILAEHADGTTTILAEVTGNYQRNCRHRVVAVGVKRLRVEILATNGLTRAQVYGIRVLSAESIPA